MAPRATAARAAVSACVRAASCRASVPARAVSTSAALGASSSSSSYTSPFSGDTRGNYVPDFSKYRTSSGEQSNKLFSYFTVGALGAISAAAAKSTVQGACVG
jgi:ubiquinol-cytochrome c reductase iron-sulfur subunit